MMVHAGHIVPNTGIMKAAVDSPSGTPPSQNPQKTRPSDDGNALKDEGQTRRSNNHLMWRRKSYGILLCSLMLLER